jgi:hypothetical protein
MPLTFRHDIDGAVDDGIVGADGVRLYLGREDAAREPGTTTSVTGDVSDMCLCDTPFEHTQAHHVTYYGLQQA